MAHSKGAERLDRYLVRTGMAVSRRDARALIEGKLVLINERPCRKGDLVTASDRVSVQPDRALDTLAPDPAVKLEILFSDDAVIVINKPGLMPCHPLRPGEHGTVMNGVVATFQEVAAAGSDPREGGLVHRLDNGTSGALLIARNRDSFVKLRQDIRTGAIRRCYGALVMGEIAGPLHLDARVGHSRRNPRRMVAVPVGARRPKTPARAAWTWVEPVRHLRGMTLVRAVPRSGSRHQIRVHLAGAGFPIVGDELYGAPADKALLPGRFWLHLQEIEFDSPVSGCVTVTAPLPAELATMLA